MKKHHEMNSKALDSFFEAVLSLQNIEECYELFDDVCTIKELIALSQRYEVAKLLTEGKSYVEISEKSGASSATISRVNRSLLYGSGGYKLAIEREKGRK